MRYDLPKLDYAYDALEPYIDAQTMEIHHTKHHQAYTDKMNAVLEKYPQLETKKPETIMAELPTVGMSDEDQKTFRNHGGGYLNHALFWKIMGPEKAVDKALAGRITQTFGSVDEFKLKFTAAAVGQFGSGWAWLAEDKAGQLLMYATANQDSPYLQGHTPIICLDVWEHAYYLTYQNRRAEYVEQWWNVLKLL